MDGTMNVQHLAELAYRRSAPLVFIRRIKQFYRPGPTHEPNVMWTATPG